MTTRTHDLHIAAFEPLPSPQQVLAGAPLEPSVAQHVANSRQTIRDLIAGRDERLLVVVGPCSIHDPEAALDYAGRLKALQDEVASTIQLVMRVYFEKPRTTVGWKGFINDPRLDGSCDMRAGLAEARQLLLDLNGMGLACATELLDPIVPQYISDLVAWAAIGARTTESQTHREMASGLSMPVGFKNATDGSLQLAIDGMTAARNAHTFLGISGQGNAAVVQTTGNPDVHLVLRGGARPNFSRPHLAFAEASLENAPGDRLIMVDCSHSNSGKDPARQPSVFNSVLDEFIGGRRAVLGMMLESHLVAGRQNLSTNMVRGQSITDACIDWETTTQVLQGAHRRLAS
ncbi:MAG: 3-deoxy-7-phosphoheptulonate synthase [Myxococcales bacterium]|nr:3-deoxy-7-phosphoheptulonate synthase [Myxococcales bacterium]